ncbi:MAG TPA: putative toxin-antitoxin system toxin component, PIN family [Rhizomicrobium sp.]|nr:putative toxin-antitoxin system toxin component, PIN family [Rhizomicrobium sp.]
MKLVFDTIVIVAALRSDAGASRRLVAAALERDIGLLISVPLLIEYEAVLSRREHLEQANLTAVDVGVLLDAFAEVGTPVHLAFRWRPMLRDADDDMVLETAANGGADAIVTFNRRDFRIATQQFGIAVWLPGEALKEMRKAI